MKARVKGTGEIVTIMKNIGYPGGYVASNGKTYYDEALTLIVDEDPDYWTRLEHQYAGMAMQGILSSKNLVEDISRHDIGLAEGVARVSKEMAHALVEKMKKERK